MRIRLEWQWDYWDFAYKSFPSGFTAIWIGPAYIRYYPANPHV